jgi:hypothetical protein
MPQNVSAQALSMINPDKKTVFTAKSGDMV